MRVFSELRRELGLKVFLRSELGTLYFTPGRNPGLIVRHFDSALPPSSAGSFAGLIEAIDRWVQSRPELAEFVRIERPVEVGEDFVATMHHTYYVSTRSYVDPYEPLEPPGELEKMRSAFRAATGEPVDDRDEIIKRVLARTLFEPTGKIYEGPGYFVVVEPKFTAEDVKEWAALDQASRA
ncbi:MAG TPA: hypothetical protein VF881_01415 [Polyangiaceae bacterium]